MELKRCKNCKSYQLKENFPKNGYHKSGKAAYKPLCKFCHNLKRQNDNKLDIGLVKSKRREWRVKYNEKVGREELNRQHRERYANLSPERKKEFIKRGTINAKKRRHRKIKEKAEELRKLNN